MRRLIILSVAVAALFLDTNAQMLIPLYGACTSSVQCVGVAICFNNVCQCPPVYNPVGITCVYTGDGDPMAPIPIGQSLAVAASPPLVPSPLAAQPPIAPPFAPPLALPPPLAPPLAMAAGAPFAYPGLPCPPGKNCIGNSVCIQGTCGCPLGQVVAGYSCVAPQKVVPIAPAAPVVAPAFPVASTAVIAPAFPVAPAAPVAGFPQPLPRPPVPSPSGPIPYGSIGPYLTEADLDFLLGARGLPPPGRPGPPFAVPPIPAGLPPIPVPSLCPPAQVPLGPECVPAAASIAYPGPVAGAIAAPPSLAIRSILPGPPPPPSGQAMPALALGAPCIAHNQCVVGAYCHAGVCQCRPAFLPYGNICVLRRRAKDEMEHRRNQKAKKKGSTKKLQRHS